MPFPEAGLFSCKKKGVCDQSAHLEVMLKQNYITNR